MSKVNLSLFKTAVIFVRFLMTLTFSRQIFEKKKFKCQNNQNPSSGKPFSLCGWKDKRTDRQTYMKKLKVAFRNFANVAKEENTSFFPVSSLGEQ